MTDYTDLIERLRDKAFKRCGPTMEAVHTKTDEWKAADALEAQARRIEHLHNDMKFMDGKNDELRALLENDRYTIDELRARIAELEAENAKLKEWNAALEAVAANANDEIAKQVSRIKIDRDGKARIAELEEVHEANLKAIQSNVDVFDESMKKLIALCDIKDARIAELEAALKQVLLDIDFMVEAGTIPDIRSDVIYCAARAALGEKDD